MVSTFQHLQNKPLILQLLICDLKHEQLLLGLKQAGFNTDLRSLDIMDVVAELMGIPYDDLSDEWGMIYVSFMRKVRAYGLEGEEEYLKAYADACYVFLKECWERECSRLSDHRSQ
jgi:hypothetical protein